jgi:hypothetical protein
MGVNIRHHRWFLIVVFWRIRLNIPTNGISWFYFAGHVTPQPSIAIPALWLSRKSSHLYPIVASETTESG